MKKFSKAALVSVSAAGFLCLGCFFAGGGKLFLRAGGDLRREGAGQNSGGVPARAAGGTGQSET